MRADNDQRGGFQLLKHILAIMPLFILITFQYWDGISGHKSPIHGDSMVHGYPVLNLHHQVLTESLPFLWSDKIYGGHPIHAEGQFAFFSPINVFAAYFFEPEHGQNIYHWLCLLLTGVGTYIFGRRMGLSLYASAFAMLTVAFSTLSVAVQNNLTISGTMVWIPWALWGYERWRENSADFLPLSLIMGLIVLSGYPQILHGCIVYMVVLLLVDWPRSTGRGNFPFRHVGYGLLAACLAVLLAAVQLLPLLELVSYSHRGEGLTTVWSAPVGMVVRGLLYAPATVDAGEPYIDILGSILICALVTLVVFVRLRRRMVAHVLAALFLFNLGLGSTSPVFQLLYENQLLPGLHYFRITWPYYGIFLVGFALIAGLVLDRLSAIRWRSLSAKIAAVAWVMVWFWILFRCHVPESPGLQYIVLLAAVVGVVLLQYLARQRLVPAFLVCLLIVEVAGLKLNRFDFFDNSIISSPPAAVSMFRETGVLEGYKLHDLTPNVAYPWTTPMKSPLLAERAQRMFATISPSTNLLWDFSSIGGAHALATGRRMMLEEQFKQELLEESGGRAGKRFVDYLGIRYVAASVPPEGEALEMSYRDEKNRVTFYQNSAALPRFQFYPDYSFAENAEQAFTLINNLDHPGLIVEAGTDDPLWKADADVKQGKEGEVAGSAKMLMQASRPDYYSLEIVAPEQGWLFVADANYPGWEASVNDRPAAVYSAQILGKAIWIPEGRHNVELQFSSQSYRLGGALSLLGILATLGLLVVRFVRH